MKFEENCKCKNEIIWQKIYKYVCFKQFKEECKFKISNNGLEGEQYQRYSCDNCIEEHRKLCGAENLVHVDHINSLLYDLTTNYGDAAKKMTQKNRPEKFELYKLVRDIQEEQILKGNICGFFISFAKTLNLVMIQKMRNIILQAIFVCMLV